MDSSRADARGDTRTRKRRRLTSSASASSPGADSGSDGGQRPTPSKLVRHHAGERNGHAAVAKGEANHTAALAPALEGGARRGGHNQEVRHSSNGATPAVAAVSGTPGQPSQVEPRRASAATGAACAITAPPPAPKQGAPHISHGMTPAAAAGTCAATPTVAAGVACAITAPPSAAAVALGRTGGDGSAATGSGGSGGGSGSSSGSSSGSGGGNGGSAYSSQLPRGTKPGRQLEDEQQPVVPLPESARRSPPRRRGRPRLPLPDALRNADASAEDYAAALKLERRRRQNRQSAANSRKRSKRLVDAAVQQVAVLRATNTALRKQYKELTRLARDAMDAVASRRASSAHRSSAIPAAARQADNEAASLAAAAQQAAAAAVPPLPQPRPLSGMGMHFPLGQMAMAGLPPGMDLRQVMAMPQLQPMQDNHDRAAGLGTAVPWMSPLPPMPMVQGMAQDPRVRFPGAHGLPPPLHGMPFSWPAMPLYLQPQVQLQPQRQPPVRAGLPWQPPPVVAAPAAPASACTSNVGRGQASSASAALTRHGDTTSGRAGGSGSSWGSGTKNSDTSRAQSREEGALAALFLMQKPPAPTTGKGTSGSRR